MMSRMVKPGSERHTLTPIIDIGLFLSGWMILQVQSQEKRGPESLPPDAKMGLKRSSISYLFNWIPAKIYWPVRILRSANALRKHFGNRKNDIAPFLKILRTATMRLTFQVI